MLVIVVTVWVTKYIHRKWLLNFEEPHVVLCWTTGDDKMKRVKIRTILINSLIVIAAIAVLYFKIFILPW